MPQTQLLTLIVAAVILTLAGCLFWVATMPLSPSVVRIEKVVTDATIPH